ncbi:kelch-like protein diablo [Homarus americanus]|uniref:kelch-like protein diablo n=1 Tax=Homarus americanus TaxID=6706 RepID=UPI001C4377E0|nr:kelch-like protein diablo [Homarus americanus]
MGIVEHRDLIYIIGGYTDTYTLLRDLLSYNPVTGEWKNLAPMLGPPCHMIGVAVLNNFLMGIVEHRGLIYIMGGYTDTHNAPLRDLLSYNPVTGEWKNLAPMLGEPCHTICVAVLNNFLYVVGGTEFEEMERYSFEQAVTLEMMMDSGYMDFYNPMHDLLSYNPVTGEWRALAGRAPPRYNYMGVAVLNNFLYLVGGLFNEEGEKSLERYSFEQNEWFKCSSMNFWRSIPAVVATNSLLYIIGGHRPNDHLELNQWFKCSSSEYLGRSSPAVVVTNSLLYVIGGYWSGLNGIGMVRKEE